MRGYALCLIVVLTVYSCSEKDSVNTIESQMSLLTLLSPEQTNITFKNTSIESPERNIGHYDYFYNGGGVALGDINNDGLPDIFFAGNDVPNKLYLNLGNFKFKDISKEAQIESNRWSTGVSMVDINNDGFLDIYICNSGPYSDDDSLRNEFYINNGDLTFTERASEYGIDDTSYSSQSAFFDMDNDGDLDLFVMNHSIINYESEVASWDKTFSFLPLNIQRKSISTLYRNNGNGNFEDITVSAGLARPGFGLGVAITDFDENGFLDIYVANDYFIPDFLFFNHGSGNFVEDAKSKFSHTSYFSMGCDASDFNNDGLIDLAVVDMTSSDHYRSKTLMESMDTRKFNYLVSTKDYTPQYMFNTMNLNRGKGNFSEISQLLGVAQTDWSWSALFVDLNNDTYKDYLVTNGFKKDTKNRDWVNELNRLVEEKGSSGPLVFEHLKKAESTPLINFLYKNKNGTEFTDVSAQWGFSHPSFSQGAAYGDLDADGDLDLVINNLESPAFVYRNNSRQITDQNYIQFKLTDNGSTSQVYNSEIKVYYGEAFQQQEYYFSRGYLSFMQPMAHFGLGNQDVINKVEITWPDKTVSVIENPQINQMHKIDKNTVSAVAPIDKGVPRLPFMDIVDRIGLGDYRHHENVFDDFEIESLLPHKQSTLGPCLATGDINGDGLDDIFIGGAQGQSGTVYIQDLKRGFTKMNQSTLVADRNYEDLGAIFLDFDNDDDLDLYVASGGGGDLVGQEELLQDRLYENDGFGGFTRSNIPLPEIRSSTASLAVADFDLDGDLDLFVGGRSVPGAYPSPPKSYLLENRVDSFVDVIQKVAPNLEYAGMITDVQWIMLNEDQRPDLLIVGEWMPIKLFFSEGGQLVDQSDLIGDDNEVGWWYNIATGDFDNDGDEDFIVGNVGKNNKFQPSKDKPLHIFMNDFDNTGTNDIVLSKPYKGNLAPVRGKECSSQQMPFIKDKFPSFSEFASSTLEEIYGEEKLRESLHYEATNFSSIYMNNLGNGKFEIIELPFEAQMSPIMASVVHDFDGDNNLDLIIGGNIYNTEVETPSYDAGKGLFLRGNGDGTFKISHQIDSTGVFLPADVKAMSLIHFLKEKRPAVVVGNNNSRLNFLAWTK